MTIKMTLICARCGRSKRGDWWEAMCPCGGDLETQKERDNRLHREEDEVTAIILSTKGD